jgi:GH25 family lysozyme M1 (1,4-beta-N-acetylmuramidase)
MIRGTDISHWNDTINIAALPADIAFVSVKATQGATGQDPFFQTAYHALKNERPEIIRIPYHFFDWQADGVAQAKNVLSRGVNYTEPGTGPLMLDLEGDGEVGIFVTQNKALCIQRVNDFIAYIQANCGRLELFIYSFDNFIKQNLGGHTWPGTIFWVSSFQSTPPPFLPGWPYKMWQYSEFGQLDGTVTGGNYDLDQWMGTQQELNTLANIPTT